MTNDIIIRRYSPSDEQQVLKLIIRNFYEVNIKQYPLEEMDEIADIYRNGKLKQLDDNTHFYVAVSINNNEEEIVGCGAIGPFDNEPDTAILLTLFIKPELQGKGIGQLIIKELEQDRYSKEIKDIKLYASLTAYPFYLKMGYQYIDGTKVITEENNVVMIKHL